MFSSKKLVIVLDWKPNFNTLVDHKIKRCNKLVGLFRRLLEEEDSTFKKTQLQYISLLLRPHLDYGEVLYDKTNKENSEQNSKSLVECLSCCNTRNLKRNII